MRKKLAAVGTAIGVVALPLIAATPASAAPVSVRASCVASPLTLNQSNVTANVGDTIEFGVSYPGTFSITATGASGPNSITGNAAPTSYTVNSASGGTITVSDNNTGSACNGQSATLTFGPGGGGSSSADASSGPAPAMQQFGKPDSMTCDEAQPEGLDWSGVPSGGWGESWARWMNGGNGGTVCTRELLYRAGGWVVN